MTHQFDKIPRSPSFSRFGAAEAALLEDTEDVAECGVTEAREALLADQGRITVVKLSQRDSPSLRPQR